MNSVPYSRYLIYPVPWYSFLIVAGIVLAVIMACRQEKKLGMPQDTMIDLSLWLLPCGIIGARLYYVVFSWDQFHDDLWSVFRIWEGGIAIYGGIIGGFFALLFFCRRRNLSPMQVCDVIAPGLALAQSIGRWGNWFNIEAYGLRVTRTYLCFFPLAVQVPSDGMAWHLASFFYESIWDFSVFLFLVYMRKKKLNQKGDVFYFYLFLYAAGRLIIEETRLDSLYLSSSVRISQLISIILCILVIIRYLHVIQGIRFLNIFSRFVAFPFAILSSVFIMIYSLCASLFIQIPRIWILIMLAISSALMLCFLFSVRFSSAFRGVTHADN